MNKNEIYISEIFKAIQGEGPLIGQPTIFVRVFGCNLKCSFCDSLYAVNKIDDTPQILPLESVVNTIIKLGLKDVTFTGGEPMLYQDKILHIIDLLRLSDDKYTFHFETNGTIIPKGNFDDSTFIISPKLQFIDDKYIKSLKNWCYEQTVSYKVALKFVYEDFSTVDKIRKLLEDVEVDDTLIPIYLMPEGKTFDQQKYQECADVCIKNGWYLGARLHTIIWGAKRGV